MNTLIQRTGRTSNQLNTFCYIECEHLLIINCVISREHSTNNSSFTHKTLTTRRICASPWPSQHTTVSHSGGPGASARRRQLSRRSTRPGALTFGSCSCRNYASIWPPRRDLHPTAPPHCSGHVRQIAAAPGRGEDSMAKRVAHLAMSWRGAPAPLRVAHTGAACRRQLSRRPLRPRRSGAGTLQLPDSASVPPFPHSSAYQDCSPRSASCRASLAGR